VRQRSLLRGGFKEIQMAGTPTNPEPGDFVFDGRELAPHFRDVPPGGAVGLLTEHEGFDDVTREIVSEQPKSGAAAGVVDADVARLQQINALIAQIDQFIAPILWFLAKLQGTRAVLDDERNRIIYNVAQAVDRRLKQRPELAARYEKARAYRSALALKGLLTRRRNATQKPSEKAPEKAPQKAPQQAPQKEPPQPSTKEA
jgi:hypothetical protein